MCIRDRVQSLNPDRILERGYARITARAGGETLSSAAAVRRAGAVSLRFRDGTVDARVERGGGKTYVATTPDQQTLL